MTGKDNADRVAMSGGVFNVLIVHPDNPARTVADVLAYRATPAGIQALANGEVTMRLFNTPTAIGLIKGGKLKAIAVTSEKRSDLLPDCRP